MRAQSMLIIGTNLTNSQKMVLSLVVEILPLRETLLTWRLFFKPRQFLQERFSISTLLHSSQDDELPESEACSISLS